MTKISTAANSGTTNNGFNFESSDTDTSSQLGGILGSTTPLYMIFGGPEYVSPTSSNVASIQNASFVNQLEQNASHPSEFTTSTQSAASLAALGVTESKMSPLSEVPIGGGNGYTYDGFDPGSMPEGDLYQLPPIDGGLGGDLYTGAFGDQGNYFNAGSGDYQSDVMAVTTTDPEYIQAGSDLNAGDFAGAVNAAASDDGTLHLDIPPITVQSPPPSIAQGFIELTYSAGSLTFVAAAAAGLAIARMKVAPKPVGAGAAIAFGQAVVAVVSATIAATKCPFGKSLIRRSRL